MIVKGIVSAIYENQKKLSVILPEYDNMTTPPLDIYGTANMSSYNINDFVLVVVFNNDFTDAMVLAKNSFSADSPQGIEMLIDDSNVLDYNFT